jgi:hypothetical protein
MPVIPAFRRWRHGDCEFEISLGYKERLCLNKHTKTTTIKKEVLTVLPKGL